MGGGLTKARVAKKEKRKQKKRTKNEREEEIDDINVSNVSVAKETRQREDRETKKLAKSRRDAKLRKAEKEKKIKSKREEEEKKEMEKAARKRREEVEKKRKKIEKEVEKRKQQRRKRTAEPLPSEEKPLPQDTAPKVAAPKSKPPAAVKPHARPLEAKTQRLPQRRVQTVQANSRMTIPGRYLKIPPNLRLSRRDLRLTRAFLQFPPPTGHPFKAGWPWSTTGQGHNVVVADSDCEEALRLHQRKRRLQRSSLRRVERRERRLNGSFLARYVDHVAPEIGVMPTLMKGRFGGASRLQLSREDRRRYLDMPLSACPRPELTAWCEARRPCYFGFKGGGHWRAEDDVCTDSEASDEGVEFFLKEEARKCVERVREKRRVGEMIPSLLRRFEQCPTPLQRI